jgi:hypothetical protein
VNSELVRKVWLGVLLAALVIVIEVRYAEPILDSDLFWHFAYAQQMLEGRTLVPDPTLYSWTPVNSRAIYCAWLSELALFGLWHAFGMEGLFALRYVVIAAVAGLFWSTIRRAHFAASPAALLAVLLLVVTAYPGSIIKPELFSLLFFHGALWCYFRAKFAARAGDDPRPWFYAVPLLTLVWANAHGAHVLLAPLLAATALGEILSWRFSPRIAFSGRQLAHLLAAWGLCAIAVCLTPYGIAYPLQNLAALAAGGGARPDTVWNNAHQSIYAADATDLLSLPQIFAGLAAAVIVLFVIAARRRGRGARIDYALALSLLAYLPLSVAIARASYLWPALACYALMYLATLARDTEEDVVGVEDPDHLATLARDTEADVAGVEDPDHLAPPARDTDDLPVPLSPVVSRWRRHGQLVATLAFAAVALRVGYDAYARPAGGSWLGFGVSYVNPVPEAEYLARAKLGPRFYNTFDSGGYLLWRLYPQYRVMVDPRSFPYLDWFQDQYAFANGTTFSAFLARYPADLAIIDLQKVGCWRNFARARDWHLLFYGPTAAIFAHGPASAGHRVEDAAALLQLHNAGTAFTVFDFSVAVGDHEMAWKVLAQLETALEPQADANLLKRAQTYRAAHVALARNAQDEAEPLFESVLSSGVVADRDLLILTLLRSRRKSLDQGDTANAQTISAGLARLALPRAPAR